MKERALLTRLRDTGGCCRRLRTSHGIGYQDKAIRRIIDSGSADRQTHVVGRSGLNVADALFIFGPYMDLRHRLDFKATA